MRNVLRVLRVNNIGLLLCLTLLLAAGCSKTAKRDRYLSAARKDFEAGKYENAEINYAKSLRVAPINAEAIGQLGVIYFQSGRLPQANAYLSKAIEMNPDNLEARISYGLLNLTVRNLTNSLEQANYVLSKQPTNEDAVLLLAECATTPQAAKTIAGQISSLAQVNGEAAPYRLALATLAMRSGDIKQAEQHVQRALQLAPKSAAAHAAQAMLHLQNKQIEQAQAELKLAAELSPVRSPRRLQYASLRLQTGSVDEARAILKEVIDKAPDYLPAHTALAQIELSAKNHEEAGKIVQTILMKDNANYDALLLDGGIKLVKGDVKAAIEAFTRASSVYPQSPQVAFQLARAHLLNGEAAKAISLLNQAIQLQPGYPEAILLLAEMNLQKGDTLSALTSLNALLKRHPNIPQAYLLLASAHSARNDFASAFEAYSRMKEVFPKSPEVPFFTAGLLARQNRLDDARKQCEASLQLSTNYLPAIELLVDLDLNQRKYDSAMSRIKRLGEAQPQAAEPRLLAAKVYLAQTNYPKAEEALLQTIELNPENPKAYLWLAQIHVNSGQHAEALRRLNTLVARTNDVTALMQIGIIHETLQNYSDASETYEKLLQINPRFSPALNNLAYIYADKLNDPGKALSLAERARQLLPYNPAAADTLGWVVFRKGDYARAFGLLQNAASQLPDEYEVQYHLGMAGYMVGEEDVAEAAFSRAVQGTNSSAFLAEAKTRLATLKLGAGADSLAKVQAALKENASDPIALSRLADIRMGQNKFEEASDAYHAVLKATPQNARVKLKLAQLYAGPLKDPARALSYAKEAYASLPGDPNVMKILGRLAFDSGDHTWSASLLQEAARKTPEDPDLHHALAWALYANGNINGALDAMRIASQAPDSAPFKADARRFIQLVPAFSDTAQLAALKSELAQTLKADPDYVPALMLSAKTSQAAGDADTATKLFNQVIAKYPNFTPAAREIAILAGHKPSVDPKAFELGLKARQAYPQDPQLARALGVMSFRQNDFSRAVQYLQESTRANPKDSEALFYLGSAQFRLKSNKEAKSFLQQALALNLPQNLADEAKRLLAQIK